MKKLIAYCCVALSACVLFTGCGKNNDKKNNSDKGSSVSTTEKVVTEKVYENEDKGGIIDGVESAGEDIIDGAGDAAKDVINGAKDTVDEAGDDLKSKKVTTDVKVTTEVTATTLKR
ncbi:MAG: hypothetical protein LKG21_00370 [Ruminococcus sp.]|jgi:hypothetical protein|nr:hypothetical protein [Ruminococcus sp.]